MRALREVRLDESTINPKTTVLEATAVLKEMNLCGLPVVDRGKLEGIVTVGSLIGANPDSQVMSFCLQAPEIFSLDSDVRSVAKAIASSGIPFAPVILDGSFQGTITYSALLDLLSSSFDPLTRLPWSDELRVWGNDHLERGHEVSILFVDVDDFGNFNKKYGHVIGDKVLSTVANTLKSAVVSGTDIAARYGGDEFIIGSLRDRESSERLSDELRQNLKALTSEVAPETVTFTIGIAGGRRTFYRQGLHTASMLDNLINLASRFCMSAKGYVEDKAAQYTRS